MAPRATRDQHDQLVRGGHEPHPVGGALAQ